MVTFSLVFGSLDLLEVPKSKSNALVLILSILLGVEVDVSATVKHCEERVGVSLQSFNRHVPKFCDGVVFGHHS